MLIFFSIILGAIVGSFLNAIIYRLWSGKTIVNDRSICPHCKHVLSAVDLVPVLSFAMLGGKCRYCHAKISWQYPLVELVTAISFGLLAIRFGSVSELAFVSMVFICFFIIIAAYDFKHFLILDKVLFPAVILALVHRLYLSISYKHFDLGFPIIQGLLGVCIISGFFAFQYYFSRGKWIGFGDVKLGVLLGLVFGVGQSLILLFFSYMLGAIVGLVLVSLKKKELGSHLPFGTFLAICGIIMIVYGNSILSWYLKFLGF